MQKGNIDMKIILASASPRRRELLTQIGLEFEVRVSDVEEVVTATEPAKVVEELSAQKAKAVFGELLRERRMGELVIGADTVVAVDGKILGKPKDKEDAARMLKQLAGRTHEVYTGVTVMCFDLFAKGGAPMLEKSFHEKTSVTFFSMTDSEIEEYVNSKDCMDKAGAYGIQGFFARYIKGIQGDYNNVVGLPVGRLYQEIKEWL